MKYNVLASIISCYCENWLDLAFPQLVYYYEVLLFCIPWVEVKYNIVFQNPGIKWFD